MTERDGTITVEGTVQSEGWGKLPFAFLPYRVKDAKVTEVKVTDAAESAGLGINAGHDLNQNNLPLFISKVPKVLEVSIGHALISEAIFEDGLANVVRKYLAAIEKGTAG